MNDDSLKEKTAKGLFWGGMNNGVQQLLGLAFGIILGRLLSPSEYGMLAMISIFSLIANELQNSGFRTALANLKEPTARDYNAVFWFNIIVGLSLYIILFFSAPLIADYYHTPDLVPLSRYAFLGFVFGSFGTAQSAFLFKNLMAKQQAKAGMTAVVVSNCIGVVMAWQGFSYWALATQSLLYILISTLLYWHYSSWRPSLHIDFGPVRHMFRFSVKLLISAILNDININVLNILLGRYFTPAAAGNYNQAYQWQSKCVYTLQGMLNQVSQPVMVDVRDDRERSLRVLRKLIRFASFLSFPLLFGFSLVAVEFITITIGQKWLVSAHYLQMLCVAGAFMPLVSILSNTILSRGQSSVYMWCTFLLGLSAIGLMVVLYPYGIRTMVVTYTLLNIAWVFVWHFFTHRLTGYTLLMFLKDTLPFALSAAAVMGCTWLLTRGITMLPLLLAVRIGLAALLYYTVMRMARAKILDECTAFILSRLKKQKT